MWLIKKNSFYKQYKSEQFEVVGISVDTDKQKEQCHYKDKLEYELIDPSVLMPSLPFFLVEQLPNSYLLIAQEH
jgi:hypothetical protein